MSGLGRMVALVRLAYHESGQVLLADFIGMPITGMSVNPPARREIASVRYPGRGVRRRLLVICAGGIAERLLCEERHWPIDGDPEAVGRSSEDQEKIERVMRQLAEPHRAPELAYVTNRAENILRIRWDRIGRLSGALTMSGYLSPMQIAEILSSPL